MLNRFPFIIHLNTLESALQKANGFWLIGQNMRLNYPLWHWPVKQHSIWKGSRDEMYSLYNVICPFVNRCLPKGSIGDITLYILWKSDYWEDTDNFISPLKCSCIYYVNPFSTYCLHWSVACKKKDWIPNLMEVIQLD